MPVSLNIIMTITVKRMNEKSPEEHPAEQLVTWEVVLVVSSAAPGDHRPLTLSPVKANIFTQGSVTTLSIRKKSRRVDGGLNTAVLRIRT